MCIQEHLKVHNGINVNAWEPLKGKMEQIWDLFLLFLSKKTKNKQYLRESKAENQKNISGEGWYLLTVFICLKHYPKVF